MSFNKLQICTYFGLDPNEINIDADKNTVSLSQNNLNILKYNILSKYNRHCITYGDIYEHLPTLMNYAEKCDSIIELGVRGIVSSWAFIQGLTNSPHPNKRLVFNDITTCNTTEATLLASLVGINVKNIWKNDLDIDLTDLYFDLTFIDTWHVYGQLKRELKKYAPHTKKYIIIHDTTVDEWQGETIRRHFNPIKQSEETGIPIEEILKGLWPAVDEFLAENKDEWVLHERYTNNNGLTILKRISSNMDNSEVSAQSGGGAQ